MRFFEKSVGCPVVSGLACSVLLAALIGASGLVSAETNDAAKLKELERAMTVPSDVDPAQKKPRTRAIVFDGADASAPVTNTQRVANNVMDCANLPSGVRTDSVDFAIQFQAGSARISPASEQTLMSIGKLLGLDPSRCVVIEGHTDITGNPAKNFDLSNDRANSVAGFIVDRSGIDRKRISSVGKGASDLLPNLDPRDPKHRRVVFKIVAK
ncbi:MAG: OmpA family protein [Rhodocyclaceae bacterium]|nr:OmpA family protein [Rhodocyclaceae bacterium]